MAIHDILSIVLIVMGAFFILISSIGMIRLPDFYLRMSAITKAATLGLALLLIGLSLHFYNLELTIKSLIIISLIFFTSPVGSHAIARAAYKQGARFWEGAVVDELKEMQERKTKLESELVESPENREVMSELADLYGKLPELQGGSLKKANKLRKKLRK